MEERNDTQPSPPAAPENGMPRWVKVSLIIALALVALFGIAKLVGSGNHGPGRHIPIGNDPTPADVGEHRPPPGIDHGPNRP